MLWIFLRIPQGTENARIIRICPLLGNEEMTNVQPIAKLNQAMFVLWCMRDCFGVTSVRGARLRDGRGTGPGMVGGAEPMERKSSPACTRAQTAKIVT